MKWLVVLLVVGCSESRELSVPCVDCTVTVHPRGILDQASDDFHGKELARQGYDFGVCASCHGDDLRGGAAKVDCMSCHSDGPSACVTCHGDGPTTGAHLAHRGTTPCAECHTVPAAWDAPGHILGDRAPAEVTFGARARLTPVAADREGPPAFADGTCSNVYCHGDALGAAGGTATRPRWNEAAPTGTCVRCHAAPPPSHLAAQTTCIACHPASAHIDGITQVGSSSGCDGCHGTAASAAPPRDLLGNMFTTALGVGAHQAHLQAPAGLRGPIACTTCHLVPGALTATGHIDSALPAEIESTLAWDRTSATCSSAWCHGVARPVWTQTGGAACGSCHGIPPATASHAPGMPLTSCATCHPQTVTSTGSIVITAGPNGSTSEHMDGDIDAP
ncbi:MAG: cytochrome family protein [Myxococcales bacterium]|nr:cytochrome family protein [Myxococcales bacterium]